MELITLKEAGLTDGEIKVYMALLELGSTTTGPIVEKSGIAKSIVYIILEKLMQKGLTSFITKERRKYFQAAEPTKILQFIDEREQKLIENKRRVEELLPELLLKQKTIEHNEANFYIGFKGIRTAHEHYLQRLKKGEEYCYLGVPAFQPKEQHLYWQKDHLKRIKAGLTCRILFNRDTDRKILENRSKYKGADSRYMPADLKTPACFMMYKDTTVIVLQSPKAMAVEIINQQITDSFMEYFEAFWKNSEPFK